MLTAPLSLLLSAELRHSIVRGCAQAACGFWWRNVFPCGFLVFGSREDITADEDFKRKLDTYLNAKIQKEEHLYNPFVLLANDCLDKLGVKQHMFQFCRDDPVFLLGSKANRKPDVMNVGVDVLGKYNPLFFGKRLGVDDMSDKGPRTAFHWREILSFWEFKLEGCPRKKDKKPTSKEPKEPTRVNPPRSVNKQVPPVQTVSAPKSKEASLPPPFETKYKEDPRLQCTSYALELLSNGGLRSHVISVLVSRNSLELLYYDRSIVVRSLPLRFTEDTATFIAILWGFANLTRPQRGLLGPKVLKAPEDDLTVDPVFSNDWEHMFTDHVLKQKFEGGQWELKLQDVLFRGHGIIGRGTVVVRAQVTSCPLAHRGLKGRNVVVKWSWVPETRISEVDIVRTAVAHAKQDDSGMIHHLPNIYDTGDFVDDIPTFIKERDGYEKRDELQKITDLEDAAELAIAFKEIFECYRWLYEKHKIIHRDISVNNLMFQRIDDQVHGVLNDFDLAVFHEHRQQSTSKQRTGTKPYMAMDLLVTDPPKHLYRHDLESFLYVLAFLTCETNSSSLVAWEYLGMEPLREKKHFVLTASNGFPAQRQPFLGFYSWIDGLRRQFTKGITKRTTYEDDCKDAQLAGTSLPTFDGDTLDGLVTFDTFAHVLKRPLRADLVKDVAL
ncbi:hypothetical protein B0H14DRAFT_2713241 [Mycena olivaceomarginata]|nr:hypothetical protein B0H14DRAFT_2713241 [Mycena olivaceomarginata]